VRDELTKYQAKAVQPFGVNPASVASHERYAAQFRFPFPLLSDPGRAVAAAYRAVRPGSRSVLRTVYLIGTDGRVRLAQRGAPATDDILAALG
jgi:thioredoxin-dependent peroxiredoxin